MKGAIVMARPRFKIDFELVEKLALMQCTQEEIAEVLGCSVDTLQRSARFNQLYHKGMAKGRASLRRQQWAALENGNATMLIWLGKQYLGQRDRPIDDTPDDRVPVTLNFNVRAKDD